MRLVRARSGEGCSERCKLRTWLLPVDVVSDCHWTRVIEALVEQWHSVFVLSRVTSDCQCIASKIGRVLLLIAQDDHRAFPITTPV
jgi:hypothetical protein